MDEADRLSDRVGIIDQGRMLVLDSPAGLKGSLGGGEILEIRPSVGDSDVPEDTMAEATRAVLEGPAGAGLTLERFRDTLRFSGDGLQDRIPDIQRDLREAGFEVHDLRVRKPTLEDVFISLTGRELRE
jgi:ABC-2 type transport system ATP-binding protein